MNWYKKANNIILYHGSDYEGADLKINNSETGEAIFLTDDIFTAEEYGRYVYEISVNINNPFTFDAADAKWFNIQQRNIIDEAKKNGYDAVIFNNIADGKYYKSKVTNAVYAIFNDGSIRVLRIMDTQENPDWYREL